MDQHVKNALDGAAALTALGALAGVLPPVAALFTIVWLSMQMYGWIKRKEWRGDDE